MKIETKNRKKAIAGFRPISAQEQMRQQMHDIIQTGTIALNQMTVDLGRHLVEAILYMEREERAGPDYHPKQAGLYKWASQPGSLNPTNYLSVADNRIWNNYSTTITDTCLRTKSAARVGN